MKTLIAKPLVAIASWWLDDTIEVEKLHTWMREAAASLSTQAGLGDRASHDLALANEKVKANDAIASWPKCDATPGNAQFNTTLEDAIGWYLACNGEPAIVKGVLAMGSGAHLDLLTQHRDEQAVDEFVWRSMDRILRHVEVKRRDCLTKLSPAGSAEQATLERLDIAILFSRVAVRDNDIRFLNAAMKINDWSFKACGRASVSVRARYLLSLAEQESAAKEMLS